MTTQLAYDAPSLPASSRAAFSRTHALALVAFFGALLAAIAV